MQVSETRQKINRIQQAKQLLDTSRSLDDVYNLLNQLSSDVLDLYPQIDCRSQCNRCCKGTSMPAVSPSEWAKVHDYLLRFYTPAQRQDLIARVREMYNPHRELYWALHDTIQMPADTAKVKAFTEILPQLGETQCPMLVDEKCSVYLSRPAKCRAHGSFLHVFGPYVQMHACEEEVNKLELRLVQQGSRQVLMPIWNDFEHRVFHHHNGPEAVMTVLVIWVLTHVRDGELLEDTELVPDFESFRLKPL